MGLRRRGTMPRSAAISTLNSNADLSVPGYPGGSHYNQQAQAGGSTTTIVLNATSGSAVDDNYLGATIKIESGTGSGSVSQITDYNGTTKIATVDPPGRNLHT